MADAPSSAPPPVASAASSLFRTEAVEFQLTHRRWGELALLQPVAVQTLTIALTVSVGLILTFLCLAQYARKESVPGYLRPAGGTAKIYLPQAGIIRAVHVAEGDHVAENQPLLTVETAQFSGTGDDVNLALIRTLKEQRAVLSKQIEAEGRRTASERERLTALIKGLETEIGLFNDQVRLQTDRIKLARATLDASTGLAAKGILADVEFKRRQRDLMEMEQIRSSLEQQSAARRAQLTETRFTLEQLPVTRAERVQGLRNDLASVEQRLAEIDGRRAYVIRAPVSGRVSMLQALPGEAADTRRLQATIMPARGALLAELYIPTRAIGFVRQDQTVRLLYEAFPYQKYGTFGGHVAKLSRTVLTGAEAGGPVSLREPSYRALVALDRDTVDADGVQVSLQPDMLLRADIVLDRRSIMAWLLEPVLGSHRVLDFAPLGAALQSWVAEPAAAGWNATWSIAKPWMVQVSQAAAATARRVLKGLSAAPKPEPAEQPSGARGRG
jgi:membrane fusion protein